MTADDTRRRRSLSDDDRIVWDGVVRSVRPLKRRRAQAETARSADTEAKAATSSKPRAAKAAPSMAKPLPPKLPQAKLPPALMPIDRKTKQRLVRGTIEIDGRLDLHGRTQSEAHDALLRFLHRAQGHGWKTVLVITGKGSADLGGRGVLRRQVPLWLALPDVRVYVLGFEDAHTAHGGAGALYVRLRRVR